MLIKIAKNLAALVFIIVVIVIFLAMSTCTGESTLDNIEAQVAADSVEQYDIAKKQGDPMMTCVQAGMVSAAYLQAKDDTNYNKWKDIEKSDCSKAGL